MGSKHLDTSCIEKHYVQNKRYISIGIGGIPIHRWGTKRTEVSAIGVINEKKH